MTSRRTFLKGGMASLFLPMSSYASEVAEASDKSLIIVFLKGGPSSIDMFDMKPNAPLEYRGDFNPISTCVPDIHITEHLPLLAQQQDKFSIVRSMSHSDSNHGLGLLFRMKRVVLDLCLLIFVYLPCIGAVVLHT